MNRQSFKIIAKWLWMLAVFSFAVLYTYYKKELILQTFSMLSAMPLLLAALLILFAKLCLVFNMKAATSRFDIHLSWWDCYHIYNFTQLAKYIPGSIWQFVGRISILHEKGIKSQSIRDSLIAEHFWVVGSAVLLSCLLVFTSIQEFFRSRLSGVSVESLQPWFYILVFCSIAAVLAAFFFNKRLLKWTLRFLPPPRLIALLMLTWTFFGASLWVTLAPFATQNPALPFITGVYCFSFLSGFLVPFSPAGLGIREAVLTFCLTSFIHSETALLLAAINRIIYFSVEVFLVVIVLPKHQFDKHQSR